MKTRCALKILFRLRTVFPKDRVIAESILSELTNITENNDMQKDIQTLAIRYKTSLEELLPKMKDNTVQV